MSEKTKKSIKKDKLENGMLSWVELCNILKHVFFFLFSFSFFFFRRPKKLIILINGIPLGHGSYEKNPKIYVYRLGTKMTWWQRRT